MIGTAGAYISVKNAWEFIKLADYRRFIAYIYEYTNGRKSKNTGFTKVESRNGICKLQVHLQNIPQDEESINIYGVVREAAWLLGIFLGRVSVEGSTAEIQITTPAAGIGDTEYTLDQISGLWIKGQHGGLYITIWDDEPVDIKRFVLELPTRPGSRPAMNDRIPETEEQESEIHNESIESQNDQRMKNADLAQDSAAEQRNELEKADIDNKSNAEPEQNAESQELTVGESDLESKNNAEKDEIESQSTPEEAGIKDYIAEQEGVQEKESIMEQETDSKEEGITEPVIDVEMASPEKPGPEKPGPEKSNAEKSSPEKVHDVSGKGNDAGQDLAKSGTGQKTDNEKSAEDDEKELGMQEAIACPFSNKNCQNPCNRTTSIDRRWQCLSEQYKHMNPFSEDDIVDCIQIAPKDLAILRQNTWRLGRNSFLMHGYYNYHHILLGKCRSGGYIIAVPGIYENQESFMASMFGFPHFKKAKEQDRTGRFGYWYRPIE